MTVTEADRLASEGELVELSDGRQLGIRFDFSALRVIDQHGGVKSLMNRLLGEPLGEGFYEALFTGLKAGLSAYKMSDQELESLLDPRKVLHYTKVLTAALIEAFPQEAQETMKARRQEVTTEQSPGPTGTTSQPSDTAETTPSSGG